MRNLRNIASVVKRAVRVKNDVRKRVWVGVGALAGVGFVAALSSGAGATTALWSDRADLSGTTIAYVFTPDAPSGLLAWPGSPPDTSVALAWAPPPGQVTHYEVETSLSPDGPFAPAGTSNDGSHTVIGLNPATSYWARVRACNTSARCSAWVVTAVDTAPTAPDSADTGGMYQTAATSTTITMSFPGGGQGATSWEYQRGASSSGPWVTETLTAADIAARTHTSTGLTPATAYYFQVRACYHQSCSPWVVGTGYTTPNTPTLTLAAGNPTTTVIEASWGVVGNVTGFNVERATTNDFAAPIPVATNTTATSHSVTGLSELTTYYFRVQACYQGVCTDWVSGSLATTTDVVAPAQATLTQTGVGATTWNVSCAAVTDATSYTIQRATNAAFTAGLTTVNSQTAAWTGLTSSQAYYARCRATNIAGDGPWSPAISIPALPAAPTLTTSTVSGTAWSVAASNVTGAASYTIQRASTSSFTTTTTVNAQTAAWTGLSSTSTYYARARAVNARGNSDWSPTLSIPALPAAPGAPTSAG